MALQAIINRDGIYCIVLEEYSEGVYVLAYESSSLKPGPFRDHLQNDWAMAKRAARSVYGIEEKDWKVIPDTHFNG